MNILITGGAGFLGINCIRYLLAKKNYKLTSLDIAPFDYPEKAELRCIQGDIRDINTVRQCMQGMDMVVHTAAALPLYSKQDIFSTDVDGTRILLEEAQRNAVSRFVMISSTAVYGVPDHHPLYETDSVSGVGDYGIAKIQAEELCVQFRSKGMCVPILRPKSFIGPERLGVFAMLYDWAKDGRGFPLIGKGSNRYQLLDVEDLCAAIFLCITLDDNKVNDTFNIGAQEFATMREDFQSVLDAAGKGKKIRCFPAAPVILALKILEFLKVSPLYKWIYETADKDSFVSVEKAQKILGFKAKYSNQDALLRNYRWYLEHLDSFRLAKGISHRVPWDQGILKFAKLFF